MKSPFNKSNAGEESPASLFAALVLVALVPAVCVLWFMTAAMRNERLAVQQRLTDVYLNHLASVQRQLTSFWKDRQAALQSFGKPSPPEIFAGIARSNLADSVVVYDSSGKPLYPSPMHGELMNQTEEKSDWTAARELEFQKTNYLAAAQAYGRVAESSRDIPAKAKALQAQAGCLLKAGQQEEALQRLSELANNSNLRDAISAQGSLIVPNVQLLILKLTRDPANKPGRSRRKEALTSQSERGAPNAQFDQSLPMNGRARGVVFLGWVVG